jgi:DUF971 family protein
MVPPSSSQPAPTTPRRLNVRKTEHVEIEWADGATAVYPLDYLRSMCPCATCRVQREQKDPHSLMQAKPDPVRSRLTILPGNYSVPLTVKAAELVGNYALRIEWSDEHATGIYSFQYLRSIMRQPPAAR